MIPHTFYNLYCFMKLFISNMKSEIPFSIASNNGRQNKLFLLLDKLQGEFHNLGIAESEYDKQIAFSPPPHC